MRIHRRIILFITLFILSYPSSAQTNQLDSLNHLLNQSTNDSIRLQRMIDLADKLLDYDMAKGLEFALKAADLADEIMEAHGIAQAKACLGRYLREKNLLDSATNCFNDAIEVFEQMSDKHYLSATYNDIGKLFQRAGKHDRAIEKFTLSIEIAESVPYWNEVGKGLLFNAKSHSNLGSNEKARKYLHRALEIFKWIESEENQAFTLYMMGDIQGKFGQFPEALVSFENGLALAEKIGNRMAMVKNMNGLGTIFAIRQDYDQSIAYFTDALNLTEKLGHQFEYAGILHNVAFAHVLKEEFDQALVYYKSAVAFNRKYNFSCLLPYSYEGTANILLGKGLFAEALIYFDSALIASEECQMSQNQVTVLQGKAKLRQVQGKPEQAILLYSQSLELAENSDFITMAIPSVIALIDIYKGLKDYEAALRYHEKLRALEDSISQENTRTKLAELKVEYEAEREKQKVRAEKELQEIQFTEAIKYQELQKKYLFIGMIFLILTSAMLGWQFQAKKRTNHQLLQLNEEKNELISVVAHDLRSPLNNVSGILPILKNDLHGLSKEQDKFINLIRESTDRLKEMISRILDVNAIESHMINLRQAETDLGELLNLVAQSYHVSAKQKEINIVLDVKESISSHVDRNYLIQVLENLVSNAIKFSHEGKRIWLSLSQEGNDALITIRDEGPGIPTDEQAMLFSRYEKLSVRPTATESSTGLGLSIAKKYVDAMNGNIQFESLEGEGTTFYLRFDLV